MAKYSLSSMDILKDLQEIYLMALDKGQYAVALKVKELLGREAGLFAPKNNIVEKNKFSLESLSDETITRLIEELEAKVNVKA